MLLSDLKKPLPVPFNYRYWFRFATPNDGRDSTITLGLMRENKDCGTCACLAGEICLMYKLYWTGKIIPEAAGEWLGLNPVERMFLFDWNIDHAHLNHAIARIEHLLAGKSPYEYVERGKMFK